MERPLFVDLTNSLALVFLCRLAAEASFVVPEAAETVSPLAATGLIVLIGLLFAARYVTPTGGAAQIERRARSRVRALGAQWPWSIVAALAVTAFLLAFLSLYTRLVPPTEDPADPLTAYLNLRFGWIPVVVAFALVEPFIEEVVFRGWVQGRISHEFGPESAITSAAALFAVARLDIWGVPYFFLLGVACGYSVYLTRSIWSGVLIHVAFSSAALGLGLFFPTADAFPALSAGVEGTARVLGVMAISAVIAVVAWRHQRVIRDRVADATLDDAEHVSTPAD